MRKAFQSGIIDIGSYSVRLELFEIRADGAFKLLESAYQNIPLGHDVFLHGAVSPQNINLLCAILREYTRKLQEYDISVARVIATSALREASNRELVLNRLFNACGLPPEVLESQEEARLHFLAMRDELRDYPGFMRGKALTFIVGTGSLIVIYSINGTLKFSEAVPLGTLRIFDELGRTRTVPGQIAELLDALELKQHMIENAAFNPDEPLTLIGMGSTIRELAASSAHGSRLGPGTRLDIEEANKLVALLRNLPPEQLTTTYHLSELAAMALIPSGEILDFFLHEFPCAEFICPAVTTRSALVAEMVRRDRGESDPFLPDLFSAAEQIGHKYGFDAGHAACVRDIAVKIFDKLRKGFHFAPRMRVLLTVAALLHDIGRYVDTRSHHRHSCYLIANAQLPGISAAEQKIIAAIARYHRKNTPSLQHPEYAMLPPEDRVKVLQLAAILRVADALDRAHAGRFRNIRLALHREQLAFKMPERDADGWESASLTAKGELFREVFGLEPVIEAEAEIR